MVGEGVAETKEGLGALRLTIEIELEYQVDIIIIIFLDSHGLGRDWGIISLQLFKLGSGFYGIRRPLCGRWACSILVTVVGASAYLYS